MPALRQQILKPAAESLRLLRLRKKQQNKKLDSGPPLYGPPQATLAGQRFYFKLV